MSAPQPPPQPKAKPLTAKLADMAISPRKLQQPGGPVMPRIRRTANVPDHKPGLWQTIADHPLLRLIMLAPKAPYNLLVTPPDPWSGSVSAGRDILRHQFCFSGQNFAMNPVQWKNDAASPDWLTGLHSFEWLRDLRALGGDNARRIARVLVKDWLLHYRRWDALAWRPDITGARLAAWIGLHDFFLSSADDGYRLDIFEAIQQQSRYLLRILPGHTKGSRLITALKGQIYACLALPNSQTRLFQALTLLQGEIGKQILPDGGHIERNPLTHAQVLRHFIDIRSALRCAGLAVPDSLQQAIHGMAPMLRFYLHGDGRLAQFNGASESDSLMLEMILQQAHANGKAAQAAPNSGYERLQLGRSVVLLDVGRPPPSGYETHLHAAPLAFEFSIGRERLVVNCGHAGTTCRQLPMTMALRNTAAHSTVCIAHTNALELRGDGGIGRRPRNMNPHREATRDQLLVAASHDGYHSNLGVLHTRQLYLGDQGEDLRGQDILVGSAGHPFCIRFHLAPDVKASLTGNNTAVLLRLRSGAGWRFRCQGAAITLEDSVYMAQAGDAPKKTTQIVLSGHTADKDLALKWSFQREKKVRTNAQEIAEEKAGKTKAESRSLKKAKQDKTIDPATDTMQMELT